MIYYRLLDVFIALLILILCLPIFILLLIFGYLKYSAPFFTQDRIGKNKKIFKIIKFRSLPVGTEDVPSHLIPENIISKYGKFLRKTKLDELPQLINVLLGDMSIVGPRPSLVSQYELIYEREKRHIYDFYPGITGYSQINNIDMRTPIKLAEYDQYMVINMNLYFYIKIIIKTFIRF